MWKSEHRRAAKRMGLRYPSDLRHAQWALLAPLISPTKRGSRRREVNVREVLSTILSVLWTGCQRMLLQQGPAAEERGTFLFHAVELG